MIVALLIIIVLILLFGAGVVKGWLANMFGAALGFCLVIGILIWVNSNFGEYGTIGVVAGFVVLLLLVAQLGSDESAN